MPPLAALGIPTLPVTDAELEGWQSWTAAVLGALAALDGPLGEAPPEALLTHFHPLVLGAAVLLAVLRDEATGEPLTWPATAVEEDDVRVRFADGRGVRVSGLRRIAPPAPDDSWLTALVALVQVTLRAVDRDPDLAPALPPTLRFN